MSITKGLAQSPIQAAIVTLLLADATLTDMVGARIYDAVPESLLDPYIVVSGWSEGSNDTLEDGDAGIGSEAVITIDAFTDDARASAGFKKVQTIADRVKILLHGQPLTIDGWVLVVIEHEDTIVMPDEDEAGRPKRHSSSTYRVIAEAA